MLSFNFKLDLSLFYCLFWQEIESENTLLHNTSNALYSAQVTIVLQGYKLLPHK